MRERFWIRVLKCKVPNGYNQNDGGGSIHKPRFSLMVGNNIKQLRETLGLTQQKFAERIGIKQNTIASAESNKRNNLSRQILMLISREFGVRLEWLETGEGDMFNPPPEKDFLDLLAEERRLNTEEKALIGSIVDLPRPAREAVIDWAFKFLARIEAEASEQKENQIRELERSIAEQQKKLERLKGGKTAYVEDLSTETG